MKYLKTLKNHDEDDLMSKILFLYFAFVHGGLGTFFMIKDMTIFNSKAVIAMSNIIPIKVWGFVFLVTALCYVLAAIHDGKPKFIYMTIGGLLGSMVFGLLSMAMFELSAPQLDTTRYGIISSIDLIISMVGGIALWKLRNLKKKGI